MNNKMSNMTNPQRIQRAMGFLSGQGQPPTLADFAQAAHLFGQAQDVPFAKAKLAVLTALGCGVEQDYKRAGALFVEAVMGGFPPLMTDMAVILEAYGGHEGLVSTLLRQSARRGDMTARYLLVRAAMRGAAYVSAQDWAVIKDGLPQQAPLLKGEYQEAPPIEPASIDRKIMTAAVNAIWPQRQRQTAPLTTDHDIRSAKNTLTPLQCDYLIMHAAPLMQPSKVVAESGSLHASFRTSDGAVILPAVTDMPVVQILFAISAAAGMPPEQGEFLSLLRYRPGQEYRAHHDYLSKDEADYSQIGRTGQRQFTALTYLNAGYSGGQTAFPDLDVTFKGGVGDTLIFANTDDEGTPLPKSRHAGMPVDDGEKWLATLWVREKPFWPWIIAKSET